jgi:acyl-CoA thioester hydrolase
MPTSSPLLPAVPCVDWPVRVYYEDTDAAGVVYYASYLRFCERARTECLRAQGLSQSALAMTQARAFVVSALEARYRQPARLDDALVVKTAIVELRHASLVFLQRIFRCDALIFDARVQVVCIDTTTHKPCAIPSELRSLLASTSS